MPELAFSGCLVSGKGEGAFFTRADWARSAFKALVGIDPWPGTLNLRITDSGSLAVWREVSGKEGLLLKSPNPDWCDGRCYITVIEEKLNAAIVVPHVADYPADQVELISAVNLRETLAITDGEMVNVRVTV